jgi:hypothetical protein
MIEEFHDGALSKGAEPMLFAHLSQCSECCDYLKALNTISAIHQSEMKILDTRIDTVVFNTIANRKPGGSSPLFFKKVPVFFVYALGVFLALIIYLYSSSVSGYKAELQSAVEEIKDLNYNTKLLLEAPQEYVVKAKYAKNEIVIRSKI